LLLLLLLLFLFFSPNPRPHALQHQIRISPPNYAKFVSIPSATAAPFSFATQRKRSCKSDGEKQMQSSLVSCYCCSDGEMVRRQRETSLESGSLTYRKAKTVDAARDKRITD
jgi:hypothetical protein